MCIGTAFLAACVPEFKNPLPAESLTPDERILGVWHSSEGGEHEEQLSIFPRRSGWIDVVWIYDINSDTSVSGINMLVFEGYAADVEQHKFLCLRQRQKDLGEALGSDAGYLIVHYEITKAGVLFTKPLSKECVKKLIKAGILKGRVRKHAHGETITVTSSSGELTDVIAQQGVKHFLDDDDGNNRSWTRWPGRRNKPTGGDS
jgi:hypothetical protein